MSWQIWTLIAFVAFLIGFAAGVRMMCWIVNACADVFDIKARCAEVLAGVAKKAQERGK